VKLTESGLNASFFSVFWMELTIQLAEAVLSGQKSVYET
jgi:hypothetical protein